MSKGQSGCCEDVQVNASLQRLLRLSPWGRLQFLSGLELTQEEVKPTGAGEKWTGQPAGLIHSQPHGPGREERAEERSGTVPGRGGKTGKMCPGPRAARPRGDETTGGCLFPGNQRPGRPSTLARPTHPAYCWHHHRRAMRAGGVLPRPPSTSSASGSATASSHGGAHAHQMQQAPSAYLSTPPFVHFPEACKPPSALQAKRVLPPPCSQPHQTKKPGPKLRAGGKLPSHAGVTPDWPAGAAGG